MKFDQLYKTLISELNNTKLNFSLINEEDETLIAQKFVDEYNTLYNEKNMNAIINADGTININGNIETDIMNSSNILKQYVKYVGPNQCVLSIKFNKITGNFSCSHLNLINLTGCPSYVGGDFDCSYNKLTDLINCPQTIGGKVNCSYNKLENLNGCLNIINGDFDCSFQDNYHFNFDGGPSIVNGNFICHYYYQMDSSKGCPQNIKGECILDIYGGIFELNTYPKSCKKLYITIGKNDDIRTNMFNDIKKLKRVVKYPVEINDKIKIDVSMQADEYSNPYDPDDYAAGDTE